MDVQKIAALAKLCIPDEQVAAYASDMKAILAMVEQLPEAVDDGPGEAVTMTMALREDVVAPSLPREALLQNAPASDGTYFMVPRVMEDTPEG